MVDDSKCRLEIVLIPCNSSSLVQIRIDHVHKLGHSFDFTRLNFRYWSFKFASHTHSVEVNYTMCAGVAQPSGAVSDDDVWGEHDDTEAAEQEELSREWLSRRQQYWNVRISSHPPLLQPAQIHFMNDKASIKKLTSKLCWQSGYREGMDEDKGETVQEGFNTGSTHLPAWMPSKSKQLPFCNSFIITLGTDAYAHPCRLHRGDGSRYSVGYCPRSDQDPKSPARSSP